MSEETVTFNLELNVERTYSEVRQLETLLYRTLGLARRLGLPENIEDQMVRLQKLMMTIRMLHTAMIALQTASGPIGWALAIVGAATAFASVGTMMEMERAQY